ncbi:hypothetical protein SeMB42_g05818 [Synchytrium endobioticum]|nr:hypothetical protein SeMB42_g05818 [Synchytrium endobioticum]
MPRPLPAQAMPPSALLRPQMPGQPSANAFMSTRPPSQQLIQQQPAPGMMSRPIPINYSNPSPQLQIPPTNNPPQQNGMPTQPGLPVRPSHPSPHLQQPGAMTAQPSNMLSPHHQPSSLPIRSAAVSNAGHGSNFMQPGVNGLNGIHNSDSSISSNGATVPASTLPQPASAPHNETTDVTALAQQLGSISIASKPRAKRVYAGHDGSANVTGPESPSMPSANGLHRPAMTPLQPHELQQQSSFHQLPPHYSQQMTQPFQQPAINQTINNQPMPNPYPNQIPPQQPGMPIRPPAIIAQPLQPINQTYHASPPLSATTPRSRIDPNQIPSPVTVQEADQANFEKEPYMTMSKTVPPLASSKFRAVDEGNCSPRFIRLTTYNFPTTNDLLVTSELPLGMIIQPLADLAPDEAPIKVVDFGENGPVRCARCKAYINPFVIFVDGGRKFTCNLCTFENEVSPEYFANLDMNGRRIDLDQRPELCFGTVEFEAPKEYCSRPPFPVSYLFCIDVSWSAVQTGLVKLTADALRQILFGDRPILPPAVRIGIMTYDRAVHFYNLKACLDQAQMMVVPDVADVFVPLDEGLLVDPIESKHVIEGLLDCLPTLFESTRINDPAVGAALQAAHLAMKDHGGKVIVTQTMIPSFGPGALANREDVQILGTDKEKTLYEPQDNFWKKLAHDYAGSGISVDLFLFPNAYIDVATVGIVSTMTGGDTFNYINFDAQRDGLKYMNDMLRLLARTFGYEALLRIRCSNGLSVKEYYGNFFMKNTTDVELAGIDSEKSIGVFLKHEGKLDERTDVSLQCALLYTAATGQRRIRLHNTTVPVAAVLGNLFRYAEMDTTLNFLAKMAISQALSTPLRTVREQITDRCTKILAAYRRHCASSSSHPGQLILPESFKLFPLYALSLLKTKAFRAGPDMSTDVRVYHMRLLRAMSVPAFIPIVYPRLFPLHQIPSEASPSVGLPAPIRASFERFESSGAYFVENGTHLYMWLGRELPPPFLQAVFDANSLEMIDSKMRMLPPLTSPLSVRIRGMLDEIIASRSRYLQIQVVRQSLDPVLEIELGNALVEDKNHDNMSYVDYLCTVHRSIQAEMTSN